MNQGIERGLTDIVLAILNRNSIGTWNAFTPTGNLGWSGTPTTAGTSFVQVGKIVIYSFFVSGTSNSTDTRVKLPVNCANKSGSGLNSETCSGLIVNNSAIDANAGRVYLDPITDPSLVFIVRNGGTASWTASGTKSVRATITYEAAL